MISDEYFFNLSQSLLDESEKVTLSLLERVKKKAQQLIEDPDANIDLEQFRQEVQQVWQRYNSEAKGWTDQRLAKAYLKGIEETDSFVESGTTLSKGNFAQAPLLGSAPQVGATVSNTAKEILSEYPEHHSMYGVFQQAAYSDFNQTRIPVIRSTTDKVRELVVEASDEAYRTADTLTRRELTQDIMTRLADEGITGIRYQDGRTMNLRSYSELVARSQTGNASRQANLNRLQEYGKDLVLISQHYPVSPLCVDWQGRVYSISGNSENYPPLSRATSNGLYHANCKHSQSGYTPGQKIPEAREAVDKKRNKKMYEAQQTQRYNERTIRKWKQRKATAVTEDARQKAQSKISEWQQRQRDLLDSNDFLRRKYSRESV